MIVNALLPAVPVPVPVSVCYPLFLDKVAGVVRLRLGCSDDMSAFGGIVRFGMVSLPLNPVLFDNSSRGVVPLEPFCCCTKEVVAANGTGAVGGSSTGAVLEDEISAKKLQASAAASSTQCDTIK